MSTTNVLLVGGTGALLGASLVLFIAAHDDSGDADLAARYQDHDDLATRSTRLYIASGVTAAAAVGLAVMTYVRIHKSREHSTGFAIAPHTGGGSLVIGGSW